ncbi:DUF3667 domain-containing protein [Inhella gelatinilytica]|uniref:DUF3667 domain-containing protein n=1 Tax=Inhella gelatinilytica TaxID=2795030 RepID=A0A931NAZ6_9BURK|nr:DUF3667 domain-containing protein [Inhella gelatinilytica]MBH9553023.1 DUF3667 domain-containing protein [Inhella gelatinilytica]
MSVNLESATESLAQALVVDELSQAAAANPAETGGAQRAAPACANCGAALQGAFCHRCGQKAHLHHSLWHMAEEFLHGLLHFETKAWRTLPALLFRPGVLTRNYLDGKRTRYVSPLALYLFLVFVLFMVIAATGNGPSIQTGDPSAELAQARAELARAEAQAAAKRRDAGASAPDDSELLGAKIKVQALEAAVKQAQAASGLEPSPKSEATNRDTGRALFRDLRDDIRWLDHPVVERKIVHAFENKELTLYKIKSSFSKFAFLLLPLALPFLWVLFAWQRRHTMFDHAVFALYSLSAMALLGSVLLLVAAAGAGGIAAAAFVLFPPWHMHQQLKGTYQLGRWGALWRTVALLVIALMSLLFYVILVVLLSM